MRTVNESSRPMMSETDLIMNSGLGFNTIGKEMRDRTRFIPDGSIIGIVNAPWDKKVQLIKDILNAGWDRPDICPWDSVTVVSNNLRDVGVEKKPFVGQIPVNEFSYTGYIQYISNMRGARHLLVVDGINLNDIILPPPHNVVLVYTRALFNKIPLELRERTTMFILFKEIQYIKEIIRDYFMVSNADYIVSMYETAVYDWDRYLLVDLRPYFPEYRYRSSLTNMIMAPEGTIPSE